MMKTRDRFFELSRRAMLSAFVALPGLLSVSALAQTAMTDPLPSWNDTATKKAIVTFVERVTKRAADLFPAGLRARPRESARPAASGMEGQGAVCLAAQGRSQGRARRRRGRHFRDRHRHAFRHDDG